MKIGYLNPTSVMFLFKFVVPVLVVAFREASGSFVSVPLSFLSSDRSTRQQCQVGESSPTSHDLEKRGSTLSSIRISPLLLRRYNQKRTGITFLQATKKKSGPATSTSTGGSKKIQVKLLKHMAGIGQAGEIVQVTPAFYQNKLRPSQSAVMVTDDQVNEERQKAKELEEANHQLALKLKERFSSSSGASEEGVVVTNSSPILRLSRKAGPGGQLFGGIGPKLIVDELKHILITENKSNEAQFLDQKTVKVVSIKDEINGQKLDQIKHLGDAFVATLALTKDVSVDLTISVQAEH